MRGRVRLALLALVALGAAPGTWLRTAVPPLDARAIVLMEPLIFSQQPGSAVVLEAVWHLTSPNSHFGSYSGLVSLPDDQLLAVSDKGRWLRFAVPKSGGPGSGGPAPRFGVIGGEVVSDKRQVDAEAVTRDPATGQLWIAYEGSNSIERHSLSLLGSDRAEPQGMARWSGNKGPEAMARLADGRFIVIGEGSPDWLGEGFPALLFSGDPVDGARAQTFGFSAPDGYRATDMAALPDGRVLILLRAIEGVIPPRFSAKLVLADPAHIRPGATWRGEEVAHFGLDLPTDNFEGLAVVPQDEGRTDGALTLWLISDDNGAALQRTLLYRLRWTPDARKARPASRTRLSEQ